MIKNILLAFLLLSALFSLVGSVKIYLQAMKNKSTEPTDEDIKQSAIGLGISVFLWVAGGIILLIAYKIFE
jgi:small neutral amino acid transporter SnatA (MarC family)